jgi:Recombinase zinc beta ribbon domain
VLDAASALYNRGGPRRTDPLAHSTLLDGGYIYCAVCGRKMTRYWQKKDGRPYYQCHSNASVPHTTQLAHMIIAVKVDMIVVATLARALTDPEELLLIADAAETERGKAEADLAMAATRDAATVKRLETLTTEQDNVMTALTAVVRVPGMDAEVSRLRARLAALDTERQDLLTLREDAYAQHATARATILRSLFTTRDLLFTLDGRLEEIAGTEQLSIGPRMPIWQAAAFLRADEDNLGVPVREGEPYYYQIDGGSFVADREADTVLTADVVFARLKQLPRDRVRALLRRHSVQVRVKPSRPRSEFVKYGPTPAEERVELVLYQSLVLRPTAVGRFGENVSRRTST